ncbi:hypothetical protein GIB67_028284 [Kingdonia uniflora]|uniref:Hexosyltransferase n=1 Tax=Kingdonia uniflora TaxID=39325 RepID=A0A7J7KZD5_9MAGN|nr:hypothetical protein GIB67_028284 [Kingdonia uniflora]
MKDMLFVARAYFPTIAKLPTQDKLSRDMKQNIQEFERILSESTTNADLPPHMQKRLEKMEAVIARAKTFPVDCNNVDKKLRYLLDLTEDKAHFHMKQSTFLYQLAIQTIPKSRHCLSMRLTVEYLRSHSSLDTELLPLTKFIDPELYHYVLISNNILATSDVINSIIRHSKERGNLVFHLLADRQNYIAIKLWFFRHSNKEATIHLLNVKNLNLQIFANKREGLHNPPLRRVGKSGLSFDNNFCTWMSGLNIVDLVKWRERNLIEIYRRLQLKSSTRVGALPVTFLTFHDMVYALDDSWAFSGLGHDYGIGTQAIKKAAVLHYNRKIKPWLELGISKYKVYWKKFLTQGDQYMAECNVNS